MNVAKMMIMKVVMMAFLMLCLGCISMQAKAQSSSGDKGTLLLVKEYLGDPPSLSSWNASTDCCSGGWHGVTCFQGRVIQLSLSSLSDVKQGTIYPGIDGLTSLAFLTFLQIPGLGGEIPDSLGNLNLKDILISGTGVSGPIPTSITQLNQLTRLSLAVNQLTGHIPDSVGRMSKLRALELFDNQLTGPLPPSLGQLPSLVSIFVSNNQLSGRIPSSLPATLALLRLNNNQFSGEIPESLAGLNQLSSFNLSNNQLEGQIPAGLSSFDVSAFEHNKCLSGPPFLPCPCCECVPRTYVTTM